MSEHTEQAALFDWAKLREGEYPELALFHAIPNWRPNAAHRRYLAEEGAKAGLPDTHLPVARSGYHGLWIEMKHGRNKPTDKQEWWLDRLAEQGHLAVACWTWEEAAEVLLDYLGGAL